MAETATDRIEPNMRAFSPSRNGWAGVPATTGRNSSGEAADNSRHSSLELREPPSRLRRRTAQRKVRAYARHSLDGRIAARRNQAARQLIYIVGIVYLCERIPLHGVRLEGIQENVAAVPMKEPGAVATIGIGNDGAVAPREGCAQDLAYHRGFPRAGRSDDLEVLGLIAARNRYPSERHVGGGR